MICVVRIKDGKITGWMMGADLPDLRRRAQATLDADLAQRFYRMEFTPQPGIHDLGDGLTMLVE